MASKGRQVKLSNKLTLKQQKFTKKVIEQIAKDGTINGTQAALETYDTKDQAVAGQIAYENMKKPDVKEQIEKAAELAGLSFETSMKEIGKIAQFEAVKITGEQKLKANIEIIKILGGYPGQKGSKGTTNIQNNYINMGYSEAKKELGKIDSNNKDFIQEAELT
jgi:phage terminase small subunit